MARRNRSTRRRIRRRRIIIAALFSPLIAYAVAALAGSLIPVNRAWHEPPAGTRIFLADNGVHTDIVMPLDAEGLDWRPLFPSHQFAAPPAKSRWIAIGAGERAIYLETPRWRDLKPRTALLAVAGGERVMHVEYIAQPATGLREIRLRPEEYRRLWAAVRADFQLDPTGHPKRIDHPGYGPGDAFYLARGKVSAINSCNVWAADKLRIAGVKTSLWSPFSKGLVWRYRQRPGITGQRGPAPTGG